MSPLGSISLERGQRRRCGDGALGDPLGYQQLLGLARPHRAVAEAQIDQPGAGAGVARAGQDRRHAGVRVVAGAPGQLVERPAAARRHRRHRHLDEQLAGLEVGGQQADKEVRRLGPALAAGADDTKARLERHRHHRQLGGRVGVRQGAAQGAAVADLRVGDVAGGGAQQRRRAGHPRVALERRCGGSWRRSTARRRCRRARSRARRGR